MATIGVIDYGMGNLHSIAKALERVSAGERVEISYDPDKLRRADRLVLPGVGAIRHCMDELRRLELVGLIKEAAGQVPMLGICLGMQAMLAHSEENDGTEALGLFPGEVRRFPDPVAGEVGRLKVPHMGWNQVRPVRSHPLWRGIAPQASFYFVHSYYVQPAEPAHCFGTTEYGQRFCSVLLRDNLLAVQFHPEKSQSAGLTLLANFLQWDGKA
ncbi:MAG TPA: imidazole glycerol phosphate synthase subunit HisH [Nevskiales bacterium]|nr:imidazole glycerol phosphate synthase subunit HisH [Nevskiales bacterium]